MWVDIWNYLRASKQSIGVDEAHVNDDRDGRYQRSLRSLGRLLATGEPLGFRYFEPHGDFDVCYLAAWKKEDYEESGQYFVFRIYFSSKPNCPPSEVGYRSFIAAEICCFYDGESPNPGRILRTRNEAIDCMKEKRGYYESK